jgi:hypothetical protein
MCTVHRNRTLSGQYIGNVCCTQKQNTFQTVHHKCVLCTETEHFPDGTSEIRSVHRDRTLSSQYIRNVYCAQKQNTFQTVTQKCVPCTEIEQFPDSTHKEVSEHFASFSAVDSPLHCTFALSHSLNSLFSDSFFIHPSINYFALIPLLKAPNQLWLDQDTTDGHSLLPSDVPPIRKVQCSYQEINLDYFHSVSEHISPVVSAGVSRT